MKRAAAQRAALARAVELIGPDITADPQQVLLAGVRSAAALLGGAEAAVRAADADAGTLQQLAEAAVTAGRLAKLALDAGLEERLAATATRHGEMVAGLLKRVVERADLGVDRTNAVYRSLAAELRSMDDHDQVDGRVVPDTLFAQDARLGVLAAELVAYEHAEAARKAAADLPRKIAGAVDAGFQVLDLDEADQERVTAAVEAFLRLDAEATDQPQPEPAGQQQATAGAWWLARHHRDGGR